MPKMNILYGDNGEAGAFDSTIFAQTIRLNDDEARHLLDILPPSNIYIGVPFVTHLRKTNLTTNT